MRPPVRPPPNTGGTTLGGDAPRTAPASPAPAEPWPCAAPDAASAELAGAYRFALEPPPCVGRTLASVCLSHHFSPAAPSRRPGTTPQSSRERARSRGAALRAPHPAAAALAEPLSSDTRGYASLEELLSQVWEEPEDLLSRQASAEVGGRPARAGAAGALAGAGGPAAGVAKRGTRPPSERNSRRASSAWSGGPLPFSPAKVQESVLRAMNLHEEMSKVSSDWTTILELSTHIQTVKLKDGDGGATGNFAEDGRGRPRPDGINVDTPTPMDTVDGSARPASPLRPGVYVGTRGKQRIPVFPRKTSLALGSPVGADAPAPSPSPPSPRNLQPKTPSTSPAQKTSPQKIRGRSVTWKNVQQILDQDLPDQGRLAEGKEQYNLWKKKVIESARALQLEANRFHTSSS